VGKADNHIEVISRGVLVRDGRVLLCRNERGGYYYLPGGHVEFGESAAVALAREFEEECGVKVRAGECVLVSEGTFEAGKRQHHEVNLMFHVEAVDPAALDDVRSKEGEIGFEWVDLAALVDLDLRPDSIRAWLVSGGQTGIQWVSEVT
jgi:ADP-ribose pyrophosphatase YjhB (NUDIX family)